MHASNGLCISELVPHAVVKRPLALQRLFVPDTSMQVVWLSRNNVGPAASRR
jgi:hypothetical protein